MGMPKRFLIALSFPGEHRSWVHRVANSLAVALSRDKVFYDEWYESDLLGKNGDLKLRAAYEDSEIVVPFFSRHYAKPWCRLEWDVIRGILFEKNASDRVVPVYLDDTAIPGWASIDFGLYPKGRSPEAIATILLDVLARKGTTEENMVPESTEEEKESRRTKEEGLSTLNGVLDVLDLLNEKLEYLVFYEAISSDPAQKFTLKKQIEETRQRIRELESKKL
jgi:hypothetical protein